MSPFFFTKISLFQLRGISSIYLCTSCIYLEGFATFSPFHPTVMQEEVTTVQTTYVSYIYIQLTQTPHCNDKFIL